MIRLRQPHWMIAFILAFATHLAIYIFSITLPGGAPVYRGQGSFDHDDKQSPGAAGILVKLGKSGESSGETSEKATLKEQAPAQTAQETLAQAFAAGQDEPGSGAKETEPTEPPEPTAKAAPEQTVTTPAKEAGPAPKKIKEAKISETKTAAAPIPRRKPKPPNLMPEMESLGRRLSVQGPPEAAPTKAPSKAPSKPSPAATAAPEAAKTSTDKAKDDKKTVTDLSFINRGGQAGTASGNRTGDIRELNYEDQVMLWLKRHGAYPREAAMYRLEDTVTMKFSINRQGKILYYELIKTSKWYLLNQAVRRMMDRSSPVPPIPPEIAKDKLTFTVPVHFGLHNPR